MKFMQPAKNVLVLRGNPGLVTADAIRMLKQKAKASPLKRARICLHQSEDEPIHEMLVALARGVYIRPHRHLNKSESFHLLEGRARAVFFDAKGKMIQTHDLARTSGRSFIYRIDRPIFHTQVVLSSFVIFYEVTRGPFRREDTEFAPWAPPETSGKAVQEFLSGLLKK